VFAIRETMAGGFSALTDKNAKMVNTKKNKRIGQS
jgi:hypothetical protein